MSADAVNRPPTWFWVVAAVALIWNLLGVMAYVMQVTMSDEALAALPAAEQALYEAQPAWVDGAMALAVFGGALGCIALLLRKAWAGPVFWLSLAGVLAQMGYVFFVSQAFEVYGPGRMVMPVMVIVVAFLLVAFARRSRAEGWIA